MIVMATLSIPATTGDVKASALTRLTEQLVELQAIHAEWRLLGKAAALYCQYLESDGDLAISTKVAYRGDVLAFVDAMDDLSVRLIGEVEASHVDVWRHALCDLAPSSVSRKLVALSGFFKWAVMWQITARNPVDPVKRPRKRRKDAVYVTADHFDRLLAACRSAKERAVLGSMYWAGLRRQEVTALEMGSVNLEERSLRVTGKGGHVREVPICWKLAALVRDHLKGVDARDPAAPLFADEMGGWHG